MENLTTLINSLSPGEDKLVRHFYKLRNYGEYRKRAELFNILSGDGAGSEEDLALKVGYKVLCASYHNLKSRLKSDIVCILLMQESTVKFATPFAQAAFTCRRALLTGEILLSRGVYQEGINLLRKAAKVAAKFELFAERIIAEDVLRNHHASANDTVELAEGTDAIEDNYRKLGTMINTKRKLYDTVFQRPPLADGEQHRHSDNEILHELDQLENDSDSSRIRFYSQLSKFNILNGKGDYPKALACAKQLLEAIETDPVVMSKSNQAGIELEIANMYLRSSDFPNSIRHAQSAMSLFKQGMINHLRAHTVLFYAQVHCGFYDKANQTMGELLNSRCLKEKTQGVLRNRLVFLKAWFHFAQGELDSASAALKSCIEMAKEKGAWFFGYSLLECLILTEKRSFEAAQYKLEALRKVASRAGKEDYINRVMSATGLLRKLIRMENNHTELLNAAPTELKQLKEEITGFTWDPSGFELVRIDEWLLMRARVNADLK